MRRKKTERNHQGVLQRLEIIIIHTCIDHIEKDGRHLCTPCKRVFNGRVLGQQLCGEVGVGDIAVMRRELVAVQTERADP